MTKLSAFVCALLVCAVLPRAALAQTPAANPMPDGSHDMYVGLGVASLPRYEGGSERKRQVLPVFQFQWSNGAFVSGLSAGIHLARTPQVEFGPLLEVQLRRDDGGEGAAAVGIEETGLRFQDEPDLFAAKLPAGFTEALSGNRLAGMNEIRARLQAGGFMNLYLSPQWRLTSSTLYGAGNARRGARLELGVQRLAIRVGAQHRVTLAAGATLVNRSHNTAFFGVSEEESMNSGNAAYAPAGGLKDVHLRARWNWALAPGWVLTSQAQASRLQGDARRGPLVERPDSLAVSTAIAWRF